MARRIVFVRHACADGPYGLVGSTDLQLSPHGLEQARALASLVAALGPAAVYCSPLLRARQTCEILMCGGAGGRASLDGDGSCRAVPDLPGETLARRAAETAATLPVPHIDEDLREIDFGQWECKTFEQMAAADAAAVERWAAFDRGFAFPGGESLRGFLARVRRCAKRLCADEAETVLAVTHGGVIRMMICHLLGLRPRQYVLFDVGNAACAVVNVFEGKGVLSALNLRSADESHAGLFRSSIRISDSTLRARGESRADSRGARCDPRAREGR